jgi:hypothetical protein
VSRIGEDDAMTCRNYQHQWDELLDVEARGASVAEEEARLLSHAATCPTCRPIAARYQGLRHALRAWRQPPVPPADLVQRILSTPADPPQPRIWQSAAERARWFCCEKQFEVSILAASVFLAVCVVPAINAYLRRERAERPVTVTGNPADARHVIGGSVKAPDDDSRAPLNRALAEATSATWDLARSASEPAARISRDVLDAATVAEPGSGEAPMVDAATGTSDGLASLSVPMPSLDPLAPEATAGVLQQVGDQLSAGVGPLSSTARHAFGFLLGAPGAPAESGPNGRTSRGA